MIDVANASQNELDAVAVANDARQVLHWEDASKDGDPLKTYRNARAAIQKLGVECRYDVFHDRKFVGGHVLEEWAGEFSDAVSTILRQTIVSNYGFDPGKDNVNDAAISLCLENAFDPVIDYLDGLKWDGIPRISTWLSVYLSAENSLLNCEIGRLSLMAAVRRVRHPGCKFDHILTLEGAEGTKKSTAIQVLAGAENFSDQTILTANDKEQQELVRGVWIYEIAELGGMKRADVEKTKAFVTRTCDRTRPAYGRHRVDAPRRCVFFATTNEDKYLKSQTGNRRFWPVKTGTIDIDGLRQDRDQLWAEASAAEAEGTPLVLPESLWDDARAAQEERREHDPWEDLLAGIVGVRDGEEERIASMEVLTVNLGIAAKEVTKVHGERLKLVMHALGWGGPKKQRIGDRQESVRGYFRPVESPGGLRRQGNDPEHAEHGDFRGGHQEQNVAPFRMHVPGPVPDGERANPNRTGPVPDVPDVPLTSMKSRKSHTCAQCEGPDDQAMRMRIHGRDVWLHRECYRF
jgi:Virulence-associated protein E-like domain